MDDGAFFHVNLTTGIRRSTHRRDADDAAITEILACLRNRTTVLPSKQNVALITVPQGRSLAAAIEASGRKSLARTIASIAVDVDGSGGAMWSRLHQGRELATHEHDRPTAPWSALRLEAGLAEHPGAARWLNDLERDLAWAWLTALAVDL
ncbi:MAG TPA: hypothetical protein VEI02_16950 [Planctomycetota bacterium]|nr:hypothetical protein [Planctomycetota bacterium]